MVLADLNLETGLLRFAQAGHPHPVLQSADNTFLHLGTGGMPVGLIDDIAFERTEHTMKLGDRLLIVSEGSPNALIPLVPCWIKRGLNAC